MTPVTFTESTPATLATTAASTPRRPTTERLQFPDACRGLILLTLRAGSIHQFPPKRACRFLLVAGVGAIALELVVCAALLFLLLASASAADFLSNDVEARRSSRVPSPVELAPPFSLRQQGSNWWLRTPDGLPFFSLGVCCVTQGLAREKFDPENPGYAAWHHYADGRAWADATCRRLRDWRLTTIGAWSDHQTLRQSPEMALWLMPVLHIGSTAGAPWWDMWDPKIIARMDAVAREQILAVRDDPRLIGYYTDNEMGWWNATLFKMTLEHAPTSGQRKRLIRLLRETYDNDWKKLQADFEPENADSWSALQRRGMLYMRSGGDGLKVMRRFLGLLADRYYQLSRDIIRKYDRRALIFGDRYQSFYYPEVARAAGRYMDAMSSNLNAHWNDGTFLRCYLDTLHALTGKPILVSEIYMAASDNRSGNKNTHGGFPVVATQTERAEGLRHTLHALLRLPYVIGADWFQYTDEPTHGRDDGENFNFGLVDIHNRPYEEITGVFAALDAIRRKAEPAAPRLDASQGIPPAPPDPLANFEPTRALKHWDRERGFVEPSSEFPLADLYVCWSPQTLYLGLYALDIIEDAYYRDRNVPKADRPVWTVHATGGPPVRARLGIGREPLVNDPAVRVHNLSGVNLNVRNIAVIELPAQRLGKDALKPGDEIELSVTYSAHCQAYRVEWKGRFTLRN